MLGNKGKFTLLVALIFLFSPSVGLASNEEIIARMGEIIRAEERLSPERQEALYRIVSEVLSAYPDLGDDKRATAREHFQVYFDDHIKRMHDWTDEQFEVGKQLFRWRLGTYAWLPAITPQERQQLKQSVLKSKEGIRAFIETAYAEAPVDIRQDIFSKVEKHLYSFLPYLGNYFFPFSLYPTGGEVSVAAVISYLQEYWLLGDIPTHFARVASILADEELPERTRQGHREFFVEGQASSIEDALRGLFSKTLFSLDRALSDEGYFYRRHSEELLEARKWLREDLRRVREQRAKQIEREWEEEQARRWREDFVEEVLQGARVKIVNGMVHPLPEYLPEVYPPVLRRVTTRRAGFIALGIGVLAGFLVMRKRFQSPSIKK